MSDEHKIRSVILKDEERVAMLEALKSDGLDVPQNRFAQILAKRSAYVLQIDPDEGRARFLLGDAQNVYILVIEGPPAAVVADLILAECDRNKVTDRESFNAAVHRAIGTAETAAIH